MWQKDNIRQKNSQARYTEHTEHKWPKKIVPKYPNITIVNYSRDRRKKYRLEDRTKEWSSQIQIDRIDK